MLLPGVLFILVVGVGFWVSWLGKPYNGILFNIHKLGALAALVLSVLSIINFDLPEIHKNLIVGLLAAGALGVVALFATGAIMSIQEYQNLLLRRVHQAALVLVVIVASWMLYIWF